MRAKWLLSLFLVLAACERPRITPIPTAIPTHTPSPTAMAPASNQEPSLVFFTSEMGKYQVWLPASDSVEEFTDKRRLFGETIECPTLFYRLNYAYAIVRYCDLVSMSITGLSNEQILDQAYREMLRGVNAKPESQQRLVAQDAYPALALTGLINMRGMGYDGRFKARLILAEDRLYLVLMGTYHVDWCNCRDQMNKVVDSFYIDPGLSIPSEPTP
jgi:hypothetical protein